MAELRTDEEQVEAIKSWWQDNGRILTIVLVIVVAAVFGWKGWQKRVQAKNENASVQYQNLLTAVSVLRQSDKSVKGQLQTAAHLASTLKSDYADSGYATLGSLLMASVYVDQKEYPQALTQLKWVIDSKSADAESKALARIRSARILLAQDKANDALAMLNGVDGDAFTAIYNDLKGDILLKQGKVADARSAYETAMKTADAQLKGIIQLKHDDLSVAGEAS